MKSKLLVLFFVVFSLTACKKDAKKIIDQTDTETKPYVITNGKHCFLEVINNDVKIADKTVSEANKLIVNLEINDTTATGNFDYHPYKKTVNSGVFTGVLEGNILKTICVFNQENTVKKEEVIFKISANNISILGGEKEEVDGIWKFKDISKGFYMNDIPRINCN